MPRLILDSKSLPGFLERLERLTPQTRPRWGSMDATRMLAHLTQSVRLTLGEVPVVDRSNWFLRTFGYWLAFELFPIPRGFKAPPEFDPPSVGAFEAERALLKGELARFVAVAEATPHRTAVSPLMGVMRMPRWQRINALHLRHHLRQFGVW